MVSVPHRVKPLLVLCLWLLACLALPACGGGPSKKERQEAAKYHYQLGYGYFFNSNRPNNVELAMQEVYKSLKADPNYAKAHWLAGLVYMGREIYVKAIRHLKRAIELDPTYYVATDNLGSVYLATGRWDDAIKIFEELLAEDAYQSKWLAHINFGWALFKKGDLDRARRHFRRAIKDNFRACKAYNNLGIILMRQGHFYRAARFLKRGIKVKECHSYAEPYYHLGRLQGRDRDFAAARLSFERCVKLAGDTPLSDRCRQRLSTLPRVGVVQ